MAGPARAGGAVGRSAAELRGRRRLRTPDAIHAATALVAGAEIFLTNDRAFKRVDALNPVLLDDYRR